MAYLPRLPGFWLVAGSPGCLPAAVPRLVRLSHLADAGTAVLAAFGLTRMAWPGVVRRSHGFADQAVESARVPVSDRAEL